uniref:Uncharacterized protein n=1 Tax=Pipistrellus kuhlii TaxID=59472 RepID=A0A7J7VMJ1_PIPKU|nr:hypothetical protein mPipKuh1_008440 [Pipistrellus kuhlii]
MCVDAADTSSPFHEGLQTCDSEDQTTISNVILATNLYFYINASTGQSSGGNSTRRGHRSCKHVWPPGPRGGCRCARSTPRGLTDADTGTASLWHLPSRSVSTSLSEMFFLVFSI